MKALTLAAYGALVVAAVVFVLLLRIGMAPPATGIDAAGSQAMTAFLLALPFTGCLLIAGGVATARGGFDWIGTGRGIQYAVVPIACLGAGVLTALATGLRGEPLDQIPWVMRAFVGWATFVVPPLAVISLWLVLSATAGGRLPPAPARAASAALGAASIAVLLALAGEWVVVVSHQNVRRIEEMQAFQSQRDSTLLAEIEAMDATTDFTRLLSFTNRFEIPPIREQALQKLRLHDDFMAALAASVAAGGAGEVLTYLDGNDPPEPAAAAPIALEAMHASARYVRRQMAEAHWLHDDAFESLAERVLHVADRLAGLGVDFTPAVQELRAALDTPRSQLIRPPCKPRLEAWLARQGAGR